MAETRKHILALDSVTAGYGETRVLEDLTLGVASGESVSVIGRNGVGKTTLLATIMGHTTLHQGALRFGDTDITRAPVHLRARAGIGYVPQEREIFPSLSVRENLEIGIKPGDWTEERVFELFPNLRERAGNAGNQLSGGEQQMLSIARALMTNPTLLLMDEPSEGLAPVIVDELVAIMGRLRNESGLAMVLVEQNTHIALAFSERTIVMDRGHIVYDGDSDTLRKDEAMLDGLIGVTG